MEPGLSSGVGLGILPLGFQRLTGRKYARGLDKYGRRVKTAANPAQHRGIALGTIPHAVLHNGELRDRFRMSDATFAQLVPDFKHGMIFFRRFHGTMCHALRLQYSDQAMHTMLACQPKPGRSSRKLP